MKPKILIKDQPCDEALKLIKEVADTIYPVEYLHKNELLITAYNCVSNILDNNYKTHLLSFKNAFIGIDRILSSDDLSVKESFYVNLIVDISQKLDLNIKPLIKAAILVDSYFKL